MARGLYKRCIAWLGLFLVLFNLSAGEALPLMPFYGGDTGGWDDICTSGGIVSNALNDSRHGTGGATRNTHAALCAFCLPLLHGGTLSPAAEGIPSTPTAIAHIEILRPLPAHIPAAFRLWNPAAARAPPLPV